VSPRQTSSSVSSAEQRDGDAQQYGVDDMAETDPRDVRNSGKPWTDAEVTRLRNLALGGQVMRLIVREMGRPEQELRAKAAESGFELESGGYNRRSLYEDET
jgi:hypothetical protein